MSQLKTIQDENLPMWLPRLAVHGGPRFLRIADASQAAVVDGSLKPGEEFGPTLTCMGREGVPVIMKRRSETVSAEVAQMIEKIRAQASAITP
jgi:hypothetical protein